MKRKTISYQGKVVFEKVYMPTYFDRMPKIFQEDEACFLYMHEGTFSFRSPTKIFEIKQGEAVIAKCGNYFIEQSKVHNPNHPIIVFGAYFYPDLIKRFFQSELKLNDFKKNVDVSHQKVEPLIKLLVESINYLLDHPELVDENLLLSKLKELLLLLGKTERSIQEFIHELFSPYEYDFKEIIQQNIYANLTLAELATLTGCSLATFKRRFSKYYQQPPGKYFLQKKLEKSYQLLSIGTHPITEIAYECGFSTANHFNKAFKREYGQTPSQLRMSQKNKHMSL